MSLSIPVEAKPVPTPSSEALKFFAELSPGDPFSVIRMLRPLPASAEERARVAAMLPEEGELAPIADEEAKIRAIESILVYHDRRGTLDIKVIDVPQIVVGLYQRAVLLLSRPALRTLSASELQGMVAHEIGHDYFWAEYERAQQQRDLAGRQTLELKCDGIAGLTLVALGSEVAPFYEGMRKMGSFNKKLGATAETAGYPSLGERRKFMDALLATYAMRAGERTAELLTSDAMAGSLADLRPAA